MGLDPLQVLGVTVDSKYELVEFVEQRGSRFIYRATHRFWNEPIALSFFVLDPAMDLEAARRSYLRSSALLAKLSTRSSAFIQVRDCGFLRSQVGELVYTAFEWVEATPMDAVLETTRGVGSARLGLPVILEWFSDSMRALALAHESGVTHGALAPSCVFVVGGAFRPSLPLKLRGFTDATWRSSAVVQAIRPTLEDPRYAAPEVLARRFDPTLIGPWTDVFGLARLFVELLTGAPPPAGSAVGLTSQFVSRHAQFALDRALADRPEQRFKSLELFRSALYEGMGLRGGRSPRRTMVVADQLKDHGQAGSFEIGGDTAAATTPVEPREADAPQPRVRLAYTQQAAAAGRGEPTRPAVSSMRRTLAVSQLAAVNPPSGPHPVTAAPPRVEYGSGVYDQLSADRSRTFFIVFAILALGGMAAYLIVAMGAR